ncbi:serpin family protein [Streptomyces sp. NPDC046197]|uniref:serpin family protein n=1 Tax=Streptomyces sp. NPDC046197 TaxID=3154337 RepID=UPI0033E98925
MQAGVGTADAIGGATPEIDGTVRAVNGLTARWAEATTGGTVHSAAGVWPLLAFLADGATGPARTELARAVGLPAGQSAAAARELLAALRTVPGLGAALGLWTRHTLPLREEWRAGLPAEAHGVLGDDPEATGRALDTWVAERTGGLIGRMPVALTPDTVLVLASALALRTDWQRPFDERMLQPDAGPWRGRTLLGLHRRSIRLDRIGATDTPAGYVTRLTVPGDNGIDVHLLLGEERMTPGQVLGAGINLLGGAHRPVSGALLPHGNAGPGLRVEQEPCTTPQPPLLDVTTVAYEVTAHHDLAALHQLFGLSAATDPGQGHFPGISDAPLALGSARQSVVARFGALGFRAAAATAVAAVPGGGPPQYRHTTTVVRATFDRPFGFLAVHRHTRLALVAGWVTDPTPYAHSAAYGPG